jgi:hypothetical protein
LHEKCGTNAEELRLGPTMATDLFALQPLKRTRAD